VQVFLTLFFRHKKSASFFLRFFRNKKVQVFLRIFLSQKSVSFSYAFFVLFKKNKYFKKNIGFQKEKRMCGHCGRCFGIFVLMGVRFFVKIQCFSSGKGAGQWVPPSPDSLSRGEGGLIL